MSNPKARQVFEELKVFDKGAKFFLAEFIKFRTYLIEGKTGFLINVAPGGKLSLMSSYPSQAEIDEPALYEFIKSKCTNVTANAFMMSALPNDQGTLIIHAFKSTGGLVAEAFVSTNTEKQAQIQQRRVLLSYTQPIINLYEERMTLKQRTAAMTRARRSLDVTLRVNQATTFNSLKVACCDELNVRFGCDRVSLGWKKGKNVHVQTITHTEKFSRKMELVQDLEATMEECLDQDMEINFPAPENARFIYRCAENFSRKHDRCTVLSVPLRDGEGVFAVLTLEKSPDKPFTIEDIESARLCADLMTPRLLDLHKSDNYWEIFREQYFRKSVKWCLGSKNTGLKLFAILIVGLTFLFATWKGPYLIEGSFRLELENKKELPAPFDGILEKVNHKPGDLVQKGELIAKMDGTELMLKLNSLKSEKLAYQKEARISMNERKTAEAQIAIEKTKQINAEMKLLEYQLARNEFRAPFDGFIESEKDLTQLVRPPVQRGEILFSIGQKDSLEAEIFIAEDQISDIDLSLKGKLAVVGHPDDKIPFTIKKISSIAEVNNSRNVFKLTAKLDNKPNWLNPGMEGLAKVEAEERLYIWIWCRKGINWLKMQLWF